MRIGEVIGKVTLSSKHPSLSGAKWLLVVPLSRDGEDGEFTRRGEPFIVYDELGRGTAFASPSAMERKRRPRFIPIQNRSMPIMPRS